MFFAALQLKSVVVYFFFFESLWTRALLSQSVWDASDWQRGHQWRLLEIQNLRHYFWTSLVTQGVSVCLQSQRPGFDPWVRKIPWRRKWQPTPILLTRKSHGQRSLVAYSSWGHEESDTIEQLHFSILLSPNLQLNKTPG